VSFERLGWAYALAQRQARTTSELRAVFATFGARFCRAVIRRGLGGADTVYGFNGAALELFEWAKSRGLRCLLEQTMAPFRWHDRTMRAEAARWPGWEPGLDPPAEGSCPLARREEAEWQLADVVLCGSEFVVATMGDCGGPVEKCRVVPYGVDPARFPALPRPPREERRLRVLFAGEVGLRKGAPYLLEALRALGPDRVEGRFAGRVVLDAAKLEPYREVATFLGPVPRSRMPELYAWADVFALPTLCEGSATVVYEALAAGLPVITTPNAGSLVRHGIDGWVVPPRDADAIARWLDHYGGQPNALHDSREPETRFGETWSLDAYSERLLCAIDTLSRPVVSAVTATTL
jgi:glycosyltransferase involved in cell wall biosynthesis